MSDLPQPTSADSNPDRTSSDFEFARWQRLFSGRDYYYGSEPGPLARRAVRYHRAFLPQGGTALDAGCGEGQDLAFLADCGYEVLGLELTPAGKNKAQRLVDERALHATIREADLRSFETSQKFDLVLASNVLQFLGNDALLALDAVKNAVQPGGLIALSLFGREDDRPAVQGTLFFSTLNELLAHFETWQPIEAATLLQWNLQTGTALPFVTLIARNIAPIQSVPITVQNLL